MTNAYVVSGDNYDEYRFLPAVAKERVLETRDPEDQDLHSGIGPRSGLVSLKPQATWTRRMRGQRPGCASAGVVPPDTALAAPFRNGIRARAAGHHAHS